MININYLTYFFIDRELVHYLPMQMSLHSYFQDNNSLFFFSYIGKNIMLVRFNLFEEC